MICIINCGSSWIDKIKNILRELNQDFDVIDLLKISNYNLDNYSAIIISGAPILLTKVDIKKYINLFGFIKNVDIPILGICFGHQIIGVVYGSKIFIGDMINKKEQIKIVNYNNILNKMDNNSSFQEAHCEYISLPNNFEHLCRSKSCNNEAMRHETKKIYSTQFHPEVSGKQGKQLFKNFIDIIGKQKSLRLRQTNKFSREKIIYG